jgi:putative membrane protein
MERYNALTNEELILRDHLAIERTVLANWRTLLAFIRTGLGLLATGVGLMELLDAKFFTYLGWIMVGVSPAAVAVGIFIYFRTRKKLESYRILK